MAVFLFLAGSAFAQTETSDTPRLLEMFAREFVRITPGDKDHPAEFPYSRTAATTPASIRHVFSIAKYEVPQNLFAAVMGSDPSRWKGPRNSSEMMTFAEAQEFCRKVTLQMRTAKLLPTDEEIRLPTEAEWEYCCRAGTTTRYSFGDEAREPGDTEPKATLLNRYAWHTGNAAGNDPPVGALAPNPWGLYDMHGYLWEFVQGDSADIVVIRGGSWKDRYPDLQSDARREVAPQTKDDAIGFRCVRAKVVTR